MSLHKCVCAVLQANPSYRGGPHTADHVDILGRPDLSELILRVVAGRGDEIEEKIVSNIQEYSERVDIHDS